MQIWIVFSVLGIFLVYSVTMAMHNYSFYLYTIDGDLGGSVIQNRTKNTATLGLVVHAAGNYFVSRLCLSVSLLCRSSSKLKCILQAYRGILLGKFASSLLPVQKAYTSLGTSCPRRTPNLFGDYSCVYVWILIAIRTKWVHCAVYGI